MATFLLVYDRARGELLELTNLGESEDERDSIAFLRQEREEQYQDMDTIEVVVLLADSEDALRVTHARYFHSTSELGRALVEQ